MENKLILGIIIGIIIGGFIGYTIGIGAGMNMMADVGIKYLKINGVNITIDKMTIAQDLWRYKEHVGGCTNALIHNN